MPPRPRSTCSPPRSSGAARPARRHRPARPVAAGRAGRGPGCAARDARPRRRAEPGDPERAGRRRRVATSVEGVLKRVSDLPLEEVVRTPPSCSATSTRSSPTNASARRRRTSARCSPTSASSRRERHPAGAGRARRAPRLGPRDRRPGGAGALVDEVAAVLEGARAAVASVDGAAEEVPELIAEIEETRAGCARCRSTSSCTRRTRVVGNVEASSRNRDHTSAGLGQRLARRAARADRGRSAPAAPSTTSTPPSPRSARSPTRSPPPTSPPACRP